MADYPEQFERLASRFADGELEAVEQLEALKRMREDATFAAAVEHQVQLRAAVGRVMVGAGSASLKAPASLAESILAAAPAFEPASASGSQPDEPSPAVVAKIGPSRWAPMAIAAVLLVGAISFFFAGLGQTSNNPLNSNTITPIVSTAQLDAFGYRHEICANNPAALYADQTLANDLERLPDQLAKRFKANALPSLDLSSLGYHFEQIGSCSIPGKDAVHLVYTSEPDADHSDRVSLWIVKDNGKLNIQPGVIYTAGSLHKHPVMIWRVGGMVYYLTGDQPELTEKAARLMTQEI